MHDPASTTRHAACIDRCMRVSEAGCLLVPAGQALQQLLQPAATSYRFIIPATLVPVQNIHVLDTVQYMNEYPMGICILSYSRRLYRIPYQSVTVYYLYDSTITAVRYRTMVTVYTIGSSIHSISASPDDGGRARFQRRRLAVGVRLAGARTAHRVPPREGEALPAVQPKVCRMHI